MKASLTHIIPHANPTYDQAYRERTVFAHRKTKSIDFRIPDGQKLQWYGASPVSKQLNQFIMGIKEWGLCFWKGRFYGGKMELGTRIIFYLTAIAKMSGAKMSEARMSEKV